MRRHSSHVKPTVSHLLDPDLNHLDDHELVAAFLNAVGKRTGRAVARDVSGITPDDLSRWRRGTWKRLTGDKRDSIIRFLSQKAAREAEGDAVSAVILKRDDVVRMLGALAPEGEAQDLKADQLQLIRQAYMRMGLGMPSWWYDLLQAVDAGEI